MKNSFILFLFAGLSLFAFFGCSPASDSSVAAGPVDDRDLVQVDGQVAITPADDADAKTHPLRQALIDKLSFQGTKVPVADVIAVILEKHLAAANNSSFHNLNELQNRLDSLLPPNVTEPSELKVAYENELSKTSEILCNKTATNILDILEHARMQSSPAALLNMIEYKKSLKGLQDTERTPVAILASGHVLPGYIVGAAGAERLYGIETMDSGLAEEDFGPTRDLRSNVVHEPLRVIPMNDYLVMDALEGVLNLDRYERINLINESEDKLSKFEINWELFESDIIISQIDGLSLEPNETISNEKTFINSAQLNAVFHETALDRSVFDFGAVESDDKDHPRERADFLRPARTNFPLVRRVSRGSPSPDGQASLMIMLDHEEYAFEGETVLIIDRDQSSYQVRIPNKDAPIPDSIPQFGRSEDRPTSLAEELPISYRVRRDEAVDLKMNYLHLFLREHDTFHMSTFLRDDTKIDFELVDPENEQAKAIEFELSNISLKPTGSPAIRETGAFNDIPGTAKTKVVKIQSQRNGKLDSNLPPEAQVTFTKDSILTHLKIQFEGDDPTEFTFFNSPQADQLLPLFENSDYAQMNMLSDEAGNIQSYDFIFTTDNKPTKVTARLPIISETNSENQDFITSVPLIIGAEK